MSSTAGTSALKCPECGAPAEEQARHCWMCGTAMTPVAAEHAPPSPRVASGATFSLNSLMLIVTLICVGLGVTTAAPGLIVPLILVVTPALVRTFAATSRKRARGATLSTGEKISDFLLSVGVMLVVWVAASIAFAATCGITCALVLSNEKNENFMFVVMIVGTSIAVLLALTIFIWLIRKTWPKSGNGQSEPLP